MSGCIIVKKAWPVYLSILIGIVAGLLLAYVLPRVYDFSLPEPGMASILLLFIAFSSTVLCHEYTHYLVARILGVKNVRLRFLGRVGGLAIDYESMGLSQYVLVALAPQILTILFLALLSISVDTLLLFFFYISILVNLAGGASDIVLSAYFLLVHSKNARFLLLYDERGGIAGGVVEDRGCTTFYLL